MKRPTIRDVARRAGVSHQTVSRVINGHPSVAESTRERILTVMRDLDFVPNATARGLSVNRTHTLGMVSGDISDYFFAQAAAGTEAEARKQGFFLIIGSVEGEMEDDERAYLRLMVERRVEGLILAHPRFRPSAEHARSWSTEQVPIVVISSGPATLPGITVVDVDNRQGGLDATRFLVGRGHREIATITGPLHWASARARLEGYREALRGAGLAEDRALVRRCSEWGLESGQAAAASLLAGNRPFTAIFAQSDLLALGAIRELRTRGIRVPQDVSVIGYDDIPVASFVDPPLTTVRQPSREVGAMAARLVIELIMAGAREADTYLLPASLVVRDSVAARG